MQQFIKKIFCFFCVVQGALFAEPAERAQVVILGGGVGALTSAVYLGRAGFSPIVIEGKSPGGALAQSHSIQNWPGEIEISGPELTEKIRAQAIASGARFLAEEVVSVDFTSRPFTITTRDLFDTEKKRTFKTQSCIVAMGATPNYLGVPGEHHYWTRGVYTCALCDGSLFKGKTVAVVGGGDSAVTEADYLSRIADKVHLFVRGERLKGKEEQRKKELLQRDNVELHFNTTVEEVKGDGKSVTHVVVKNNQRKEIPVDALFLAIGSKPNSQLFKNQLEIDPQGYVVLKERQQTSVPGVFAIGDISQGICKQAICAAGEGAESSIQVEHYLSLLKPDKKETHTDLPVIQIANKKAAKKAEVLEISSEKEFEEQIKNATAPLFVDFYATWCGPCQQIAPKFDKWAGSFAGNIKFLKVNVDKFDNLTNRYQIQAMPTLVVISRQGKVLASKIGGQEIGDLMKELSKIDALTPAKVESHLTK